MQEIRGPPAPLAVALDPPADFSGFSKFPTETKITTKSLPIQKKDNKK